MPEAWHVELQFPLTVKVKLERAPDPPTVYGEINDAVLSRVRIPDTLIAAGIIGNAESSSTEGGRVG